jgi:hypothetical protein
MNFLDAGTLSVTGGSPSPLTMVDQSVGVYTGMFAGGYSFPGGQSFTVANGSAGKDVKVLASPWPLPPHPSVGPALPPP